GYSGGKHPFGLLYFNDAFEAMYRDWWRAVLTGENPYGPPLREEPALAYVEMLNEDSTFFWTFNPDRGARGNIPDPQRAILERNVADWLRARHQGMTLEEIRSAKWDGVSSPQDDFESGRVGIRSLWRLFNERTPRDIDTATFLTEL